MILSPSSLAPVCNGGQIELTCSVPGVVLTWSFQESVINGTIVNRYPSDVNIQYSGTTAGQNRPVTVNFVTFTYTRLSARGVLPLVSQLVINPVDSSHNGTVVTCIDAMSTNTSSTQLYVVNSDSDSFQGNVRTCNTEETSLAFDLHASVTFLYIYTSGI